MTPFALSGAIALATGPSGADYPRLFEGQCTPSDPHFDLEVLYYDGDYERGLQQTNAKLAQTPDDPELYWMKARFLYEIGELFPKDHPKSSREAHYREMVATTEAGFALAPDEPHLRFARGVGLGRLGTTRGVLASLFLADDVEEDWLAVAEHPTYRYSAIGGKELLPCDAFYALGIFYRLVPDWWIVQVLAGTRGSLDKSLAFHQRAVACKPDEIQNWKELGATQLCIGHNASDEAMLASGQASLDRGLALTPINDKQRIDHGHMRMLKEDPAMACEYSRDGQQDLDRKKLDE